VILVAVFLYWHILHEEYIRFLYSLKHPLSIFLFVELFVFRSMRL